MLNTIPRIIAQTAFGATANFSLDLTVQTKVMEATP